jgi:hypothetical protein
VRFADITELFGTPLQAEIAFYPRGVDASQQPDDNDNDPFAAWVRLFWIK